MSNIANLEELTKVNNLMKYLSDKYCGPGPGSSNILPDYIVINNEAHISLTTKGNTTKVKLISKSKAGMDIVHFTEVLQRVFTEEFNDYIVIIRRSSSFTSFYIVSTIDVDNDKDYLKFQVLKNI